LGNGRFVLPDIRGSQVEYFLPANIRSRLIGEVGKLQGYRSCNSGNKRGNSWL